MAGIKKEKIKELNIQELVAYESAISKLMELCSTNFRGYDNSMDYNSESYKEYQLLNIIRDSILLAMKEKIIGLH